MHSSHRLCNKHILGFLLVEGKHCHFQLIFFCYQSNPKSSHYFTIFTIIVKSMRYVERIALLIAPNCNMLLLNNGSPPPSSNNWKKSSTKIIWQPLNIISFYPFSMRTHYMVNVINRYCIYYITFPILFHKMTTIL